MKRVRKKENPKTINEHFDQKYGKLGTTSRDVFEEKSQEFMIAELMNDLK